VLFYKLKPILIAQSLWLIIDIIIIVGIMMYNQSVRFVLPYDQLLALNYIGKYATIVGIAAGLAAIWVYLAQQRATRQV